MLSDISFQPRNILLELVDQRRQPTVLGGFGPHDPLCVSQLGGQLLIVLFEENDRLAKRFNL